MSPGPTRAGDSRPGAGVPPTSAILASIVESSDDAIISKDLNGVVTSWNAGAERVFGYSASEAIGRHVSFLFPAGHESEEEAIMERIKSGERVQHYETQRRRKDGQVIDVSLTVSPLRDDAGNLIGASKIARDVTREKRLQNLFALSADNALDAIVLADDSGRITYVNRAAETMFGHAASDLVGQPLTLLMPDRFKELHRQGLAHFLRTGEGRIVGRTTEIVGRRKDGREFPVELSLAVRTAGRARSFSGILRDATERKEAERAKIEAEHRAREIERLQELDRFKTQFINTAAHELLTPLTPMRSVLHILARNSEHPEDPALQKNVALISRSVERLHRLVTDLLDASRIEAGKLGLRKRAVDLSRVVGDAIDLFRPSASQRGVEIEGRLEQPLIVQGDADRLAQVASNLLSNAVKFTPKGGRVLVRTMRSPDGAVLTVGDTGMGMAQAFLPTLFQPFSRAHLPADQVQLGTGLGLYITKAILELHGGHVRGESPGPGKGSTFTVSLPL